MHVRQEAVVMLMPPEGKWKDWHTQENFSRSQTSYREIEIGDGMEYFVACRGLSVPKCKPLFFCLISRLGMWPNWPQQRSVLQGSREKPSKTRRGYARFCKFHARLRCCKAVQWLQRSAAASTFTQPVCICRGKSQEASCVVFWRYFISAHSGQRCKAKH